MGVSKNRGTPKWMVKIMENPIKMDDLGGKPPLFLEIPIYRCMMSCFILLYDTTQYSKTWGIHHRFPRRSWIPGAGPEWQHATSIFVTTVKSDEVRDNIFSHMFGPYFC